MAKEVDNLTDDSESFGQFKVDVLDTLKAVLENQNNDETRIVPHQK